ncbi:2-oxopent-4-enoate hydratase [Brachymonas denitrificans]|jgi:2-oxopent-4-enoate/cis-2-oxohex-4-enoate hydratase|uniref:2-oxopent-4-enoate/cis-2-oxohex-4-enoate hydratase n=1 Tax=Brachymonas denitrificans DSM 15123 TaxID=1121117 RepID=A0A1H8HTF3_9BURK|nr:2-oxopent-4-enoate hydratase [Brachymonas denitrificans]SEN59285.1 2-oxopent-4-enoate/cis-2-oxohex-4-enoate hydratase [Brachymonas denitrificans DSM 15123]
MDSNIIQTLGDSLYQALRSNSVIDPITNQYPDMTIEDAYAVQKRMIDRRVQDGEVIVGKKIGVTSRAVMNMLGVYQPDFGYMMDRMIVNEGESIAMSTLIQPKAEGEIAFLLKKDLMGPGLSNADILAATECVIPCFEIVDSRIRDWKIKIQDTVADNASCGVFVLGDSAVSPRKVDLSTCGMVLEKNGEIIATGSGAAAMGSPVNAITWLANTLGRLGVPLKAGEVVLSGALAAMFPCAAGDNFRVSIGGIGACSVRFE